MDRNIVTRGEAEAERARLARLQKRDAQGAVLGGAALPTDIKADRWHESLTKSIPAEALSLYIALTAIVAGGKLEDRERLVYFVSVLLVCVIFNLVYLRRIWKVNRWSQIGISTGAFLVYVYANGGQLLETLPIHNPMLGSLLLVATAAFLALFPIFGGASSTGSSPDGQPESPT